jgi:hypothetical protein
MIDHAAVAHKVMRLIGESSPVSGRLVLLVGSEVDRTSTLAALSNNCGAPIKNLSIEITQALLDANVLRVDLAGLISSIEPNALPLLLDRIQILMLPLLRLNALDLLNRVARRRPICASWPGSFKNGRLQYAHQDHPEHLDLDASRSQVIDMSTMKAISDEI